MQGAWVYVDENVSGQREGHERFAQTGADGSYALTFLPPGTYVVRVEAPSAGGWVQTLPGGADAGAYRVTISGLEVVGAKDFGLARAGPAELFAVRVFYRNSAFHTGSAAGRDERAAATDKIPLLPGQAPSIANFTSYTRGLNGLIIDLLDVASGTITAEDLVFEVSAAVGESPAWVAAPAPDSITSGRSIDVVSPERELTRVKVTWPDNSIRNRWLRVTVKANANTGLVRDAVFLFGNLVGETGDLGGPTRVSALDLVAVRRALSSVAPLTSRVDFNRDGSVNALDLAAARSNLNRVLAPPPAPWNPGI